MGEPPAMWKSGRVSFMRGEPGFEPVQLRSPSSSWPHTSRDDALDFAGLIQVIGRPLEAGVAEGHGSQDGDIAARRTSGNAESLRIKMELCGVRAEPTMAAFTS